ncbi:MAG TPA: tRNA (N6-isopentenyl adenosine(37)-C2)-methylthiotransferase MiaB [Candidatus Acidoferrales bacterium]|nr:tRNA (N6-isopentenyl adenosine(37)-C2)-methylthiotransferase MiaB [Candidatus Acidoferrales bacterium]
MDARVDIPIEALFAGPAAHSMARDAASSPRDSGRSFYIETFGCQMNVHDSEKVTGVLLARGYQQVDSPDAADFVFYNTCSIREKAAQKVFSRLGDFRGALGEEKIIGVLGCLAQQEGEKIFRRAPWVRMVCGSASYRKLPEMLAELEAGGRRVTGLALDTDETFETEITPRDNPFRAYVTIIEGCDYACSYCVVPHTRGPQRSRMSASILDEVRRLVDDGYTEVQLLGQTVNSYRDPSPRHMNFVQLLRAVAEVSGIRRVRFMTSHPNDFTREIVDAIDATPALCDHIHLPVQSGSSRILKQMLRTYSRDEYLEKIGWIHSARRPISVTTDIIVGFPGETENDFAETISLLEEVRYDGVFAFRYSPRPNTLAKNMPDAVPEEEKGRRLAAIQQHQREIQTSKNMALVNQRFEVLVDSHHESRGQWSGRTTCNRIVNFTSPEQNLLGQYRCVEITAAGPNSLLGAQVE